MSSPSDFYRTLQKTARSFVENQAAEPGTNNQSGRPTLRAENCITTFGPAGTIASKPLLQEEKTNEGFVAHMNMMTPMLETWRVDAKRVVVDEQQKEANVLAMYYMTPKGKGDKESRTVEHEINWWLKMTDDGKLVERCTEYIDGSAAARIMELVMEYKNSQNSA